MSRIDVQTGAYRIPLAIALAGSLVGACTASAHVVVLLDRSLRAQTVDVSRIAQGKVFYTAPGGGEERSEPLENIAAIVEPGWWSGEQGRAAPAKQIDAVLVGRVELVDGRVIQGKPDSQSATPDSGETPPEPPKDLLRWDHPELGRLEFKLEEVRRVQMPGESAALGNTDGGDRDVVILNNGDRMSGFVERIGSDIWLSDAGTISKIASSRVAEVRLVNPPKPIEGTLAWLAGSGGGSIIRVEHVGADPQRGLLLGIEPASGKSRQVFVKNPEQVRALLPSAQRLTALSALRIIKQEPSPGRPYAEPARTIGSTEELLGVRDVELPGPMSVEWDLPEGAARAGGWLLLPAAYQEWGDCTVRIEALGRKASILLEERVSAAATSVGVNVAIPAGSTALRVTVDAGAYGPIQDRIVLHRFVVVK